MDFDELLGDYPDWVDNSYAYMIWVSNQSLPDQGESVYREHIAEMEQERERVETIKRSFEETLKGVIADHLLEIGQAQEHPLIGGFILSGTMIHPDGETGTFTIRGDLADYELIGLLETIRNDVMFHRNASHGWG